MFNMKWQEIIQDSAWVVEDLLTYEECQQCINMAVEAGIQTSKSNGDTRHRDSIHVVLDLSEIAERVFDRIKGYIPQEVLIDEDCDIAGIQYSKGELYGKWVPCGLNTNIKIGCYPGYGHFGPHRDAIRTFSEHQRSLITVNGYLTDRPIGFGGATRFVNDSIDLQLNKNGLFTTTDDDVLHRIEADKAGKGVLFFHDLMHDGEPLKEGSPYKWLFHTQVIYERDPETAPKFSKEHKEARDFLKKAEAAEEEGNIVEAIHLYKRAYRLDNTLDSSKPIIS